jgi:hypothetical protein
MPDPTTPNLGFTLPTPGASNNTWGAELNGNFDLLDALFPGGFLAEEYGGTGTDNGGGLQPSSVYHVIAAAGNNAVLIVAGAGTVTGWEIFNNSGAPIFVKLYDMDGAPNPAADVPKQVIGVQAGESSVCAPSAGVSYETGIAIAIVGGIGDHDNSSVELNACSVDIAYQEA